MRYGTRVFERILLAVDGSEHSAETVPVAADLATKYGASVTVLIGANQQQGPVYIDSDGRFHFKELPAATLRVSVRAPGFRPRTISVETEPDAIQTVAIELKPETGPVGKIRVTGLEVTIADEATFLIETTGEQLTLAQYLDYTKAKVVGYVPDWAKLHEVWFGCRQTRGVLAGAGGGKRPRGGAGGGAGSAAC